MYYSTTYSPSFLNAYWPKNWSRSYLLMLLLWAWGDGLASLLKSVYSSLQDGSKSLCRSPTINSSTISLFYILPLLLFYLFSKLSSLSYLFSLVDLLLFLLCSTSMFFFLSSYLFPSSLCYYLYCSPSKLVAKTLALT